MCEKMIELGCEINWEYVITILTILGSTLAIVINVFLAKKQRTADIITKNRMDWIQELRGIFKEYYAKVKLFEDKQAPECISKFLNDLYVSESAIKLQLNCFGNYDEQIIKYISEINKSYDAFLHKSLLLKNTNDNVKISKEMIEYIATYNPELLNKVISKTAKKYNFDQMVYNKEYDKISKLFTSEEFQDESVVNLIKMEDKYTKECCKVIRCLPEIVMIYTQIYLKVEWERVKKEAKKGNIKDFDFDDRFKNYLLSKEDEIEKYKEMLPKRIFD